MYSCMQGGLSCCAACAQVWNPGFDVTPSDLIRGVITEHGVIGQQANTIDVNGFLHSKGLLEDPPLENGAPACAAPGLPVVEH